MLVVWHELRLAPSPRQVPPYATRGLTPKPACRRGRPVDGQGAGPAAVRERVVAHQPFEQHGRLLLERRICLLACEAGEGRGQRRLRQRQARQPAQLLVRKLEYDPRRGEVVL